MKYLKIVFVLFAFAATNGIANGPSTVSSDLSAAGISGADQEPFCAACQKCQNAKNAEEKAAAEKELAAILSRNNVTDVSKALQAGGMSAEKASEFSTSNASSSSTPAPTSSLSRVAEFTIEPTRPTETGLDSALGDVLSGERFVSTSPQGHDPFAD